MSTTTIPLLPYKLFFLLLEPLSALAGAYYAAVHPAAYLAALALPPHPAPAPLPAAAPPAIAVRQLANLYLLFALVEALVLSSAPPLRTWRRLLAALLVADVGHLATLAPLGARAFWAAHEWNAMLWGSVAWVYVGAALRVCFLAGVGLKREVRKPGRRV